VTEETEFECGIDDAVTCLRCKRVRPFPESGKLAASVEGEITHVIDTGRQCGDGGMGCQETRVVVRMRLRF
jgi:hypothetical protein